MRLLGHLSAARSIASTKVAACLRDVRAILNGSANEKVVIFTSIKRAASHLGRAFAAVGVGCSVLDRNDRGATDVVAKWRKDPQCPVLIIHSGVTAAGLTLTLARHLFILEPFLSPGEELQAKNRCHRIGQTSDVSTTTYYVRDSIEERLLAYRAQSASQWTSSNSSGEDNVNSLSVLPQTSDATRRMPTSKLRYILGMA